MKESLIYLDHSEEMHRLGECGCHSCRLQAKGYSHFLNNTELTEDQWELVLSSLDA